MGTPDFAVTILKTLVENKHNIVGVITAPDKPAGRGRKLNESAVKKYAKTQGLNILQPTNLKNTDFLDELKALNANLQIVVAFRMLPKVVWQMPEYGTFNLHASLLPSYRGAAPINWAIINGETKTGVTTFFIDDKIDTGEIILQTETESFRSLYSPEENFYLITFAGQTTTYCFDTRGTLEDGSYRVTRWPSSIFKSYKRLQSGEVYIGTTHGISKYRGYKDNNDKYRFRYYSPNLTFGDAARVKFLKKIKPTIVGANNSTVFMKFAYDFNTVYRTTEFTTGSQIPAFYAVNEFGPNSVPLSDFTAGQLTNQVSLNAAGGGTSVVVGLESDINGFQLSLQEINILALIGKVL